MSWVASHRIEWTDILELDWKIEIEDVDFAGTVSVMQATGSPLTIRYLTNSDNLLENPIKGSTADISIYSDTNFQWADLYASFDLERRVSIYHSDTVLYWRGFVTPGQYQEPYDGIAYPVTLATSDSLGFLKNLPFEWNGAAFTGRRFESQIILDILYKIQILTFTEFVNIYETAMSITDDDSPMDQQKIDVDVFLGMNCYEVLEHLLKKYNAIIRQKAGVYIIYRPTELVNPVVKGRIFTAAETKTSTNIAPLQVIKRTGYASDIADVEGGILNLQPSASKVVINQDYGNRESWVDNYNFAGDTFTQTGLLNYSIEGWSKANNCQILPITKAMPSETDGVLITSQNAYPTINTYIYQSFGINAIATDDTCYFEFDYLFYNFSTTDRPEEEFYVLVMSDNASKYLYGVNEEFAAWDNSLARFEITADAPVGTTGWVTYKNKVPGIPTAGSYTIILYAINNAYPQVYIGFKNIRFYSTSETLTVATKKQKKYFGEIFYWGKRQTLYYLVRNDKGIVAQKEYDKDNETSGTVIQYDSILGDVVDSGVENIIEQLQGSLATYVSSVLVPSAVWSTRGGTEAQPILQLICDELAYQYSRQKQLLQIPIMEGDSIDNLPHVDILGLYYDPLNLIDGNIRKFVFSQGEFIVRDRVWNIDFIEVIPPAAVYVPPTELSEDYGALYNWYAVNGDL